MLQWRNLSKAIRRWLIHFWWPRSQAAVFNINCWKPAKAALVLQKEHSHFCIILWLQWIQVEREKCLEIRSFSYSSSVSDLFWSGSQEILGTPGVKWEYILCSLQNTMHIHIPKLGAPRGNLETSVFVSSVFERWEQTHADTRRTWKPPDRQ